MLPGGRGGQESTRPAATGSSHREQHNTTRDCSVLWTPSVTMGLHSTHPRSGQQLSRGSSTRETVAPTLPAPAALQDKQRPESSRSDASQLIGHTRRPWDSNNSSPRTSSPTRSVSVGSPTRSVSIAQTPQGGFGARQAADGGCCHGTGSGLALGRQLQPAPPPTIPPGMACGRSPGSRPQI